MQKCFTLLFFFYCISAQAQTILTGTVINNMVRKPVEFASVTLTLSSDSIVIKGTATDKKGRFNFEGVQPGTYTVSASYIGFNKITSAPFMVQAGSKQFTIDTLRFSAAYKTLADVTVTGTRAQLNTSIDRKIYNVDQDIMSRSGTASDILRNVPSVEVDVEGNVNLRGSGDVMILINGKPNPLMGRTRAEVLQQLPANSIERIEVITNPSARYRPDGTSGIINIVLKKNIRNGFNGTAIVNAGNKDRYNGSLSLNYRPGKVNLFGSYSYRQDTRWRYNTNNRTYLDSLIGATESLYNQHTNSVARPRAHIVSAGIDYTIDEKNSIGASGTYFHRNQVRNDQTYITRFDELSRLTAQNERLRYDPEFEKQKNATLYFQHDFKKEGNELRIEFNTSVEDETEDNRFTNIYRLPAGATSFDNTLIKQGTRQNQLTANYINQFSDDAKLEAGYDGLYDKSDLNFYGEYYDALQNRFVKDGVKSNRFIFNQDVHALYATYQKSYEKFGYEVGLRAEGVITKGHLTNLDSFVNNNYYKVYPTVHLSYNLADNSELQLNYSKRVNRPDADELNPFPEYQDPRNLRAGNTKLLPEIVHSVEFGCKWQNKHFSIVPSFYYRYKQNGFTSVTLPISDTAFLTTEQNLSNDQSAGLEAIFSAKGGRFLSANLSTNVFYNRIDAVNLGYIQNRSIFSASANLTSSFTITKTFMWQVSGNYRSARLTPQGKTYASVVINTGLRQDFMKNKLSATFTASDIFSSLRQRTELNNPYVKQVSLGRRDGLIVYIGLSYRFGIMKKEKEEKMQFDNNL